MTGRFRSGRLWEDLVRTSADALQRGALCPIPSRIEIVEQDGVAFVVRVVPRGAFEALKREYASQRDGIEGSPRNPFLPPDAALLVGDVSPTHFCVLNKFNVVNHHLLVVTRAFEDQEEPLTLPDFEALWTCMAEYDALAFYNAGATAGASQPHKHLQIVPVPLGPGGPALPIEPRIEEVGPILGIRSVPGLPFPHRIAECGADWTSAPVRAAGTSLELYRAMLNQLRLCGGGAAERPAPYNLLVSRRWMLLVPRARECVGTISINALGFAGALLARNDAELELLRRRGPMDALREAAGA